MSLSAERRFCAQELCPSLSGTPSWRYRWGSHAAIKVSCTPGEVSAVSWRRGVRRLEKRREEMWGVRCKVLVRVWGRERKVVSSLEEEGETVKAQKSTTWVPCVLVMRRVEFLGRARARPVRAGMGMGAMVGGDIP